MKKIKILHSAFASAALLLSFGLPSMAQVSGGRVLGQWSDGRWYPARVIWIQGNAISVNFDDGDQSVLDYSRVRSINWTEGTRVQCNWKNQGRYYSGYIAEMEGERIFIQYDDGDQELATIGRCRSN